MANSLIHKLDNILIFVSCKEDEAEIMTELENLADRIVIVSIYIARAIVTCIVEFYCSFVKPVTSLGSYVFCYMRNTCNVARALHH